MTSGEDDLYEVVISPSFWEDWNEGVSDGWVNPDDTPVYPLVLQHGSVAPLSVLRPTSARHPI